MKNYRRLIHSYELFLKQLGYNIIYNGCQENDSGIFFVIEIENSENPKEPKFGFLNVFTGAPLSLDGYEKTVLTEKNFEEFSHLIDSRIKGCTISKSDVVFGILDQTQMGIDDIYEGNHLHLTPTLLKVVSEWVNFKGGRNPMMVTRTK